MRMLKSAILYTGIALLANGAMAETAGLEALREGDMAKLAVHAAPIASTDKVFTAEDGSELTLADYEGKIILLNFWATWCAPCRKEMPSLALLQDELGGDDFEVLTIATGRNPRAAMEKFFEEIEITNLPLHADPHQAFARSMGVLGLPVSVLLDRDGLEVARLIGDADWSTDSARAIVSALIAVE